MEFISREEIDYRIAGHNLIDLGNYNELQVLQVLRDIYAGKNPPCDCPICIEDIYALSLNSLPPRYIQTTSLEAYESSKDFLPLKEIRKKVRAAVRKVSQAPKHAAV